MLLVSNSARSRCNFAWRVLRDYIVLERNSSVGAFFKQFPIHRQLIRCAEMLALRLGLAAILLFHGFLLFSCSINKRFTGRSDPEFNLRHDWHSVRLLCVF